MTVYVSKSSPSRQPMPEAFVVIVPMVVVPLVTVNVATRFALVLPLVSACLAVLTTLIDPRSRGSTKVSETGVVDAVTVTFCSGAV